MKKLFFTAALSLLVLGVSAQKKTMKSAQKALNKKEYDNAIELATAAAGNPETTDNSDVYTILGKAYMYKYNATNNTDLAMAQTSYDNFKLAIEKGDAKTKEKIMEDVVLNPATGLRLGGGEAMKYLEVFVVSQANVHFQESQYGQAYGFFALASKIDESAAYEFYAGYSAQNGDLKEEAKMHYERVLEIDGDYENANFAYNGLIDHYNTLEDWDNALKYIAEAKDKFPEEKLYGEYEIDVLIKAKRMDQAIEQLKSEIAGGNAKEGLHYTLAYLQWNNGDFEEALKSADAALAIKPDYYDALYVAGSVHFNKAAELLKEANNESDMAKFDEKKNQAIELFKSARPYFEKAVEVRNDDPYTLNPLSTIYDQMGMDAERDKILKRLEELEGN